MGNSKIKRAKLQASSWNARRWASWCCRRRKRRRYTVCELPVQKLFTVLLTLRPLPMQGHLTDRLYGQSIEESVDEGSQDSPPKHQPPGLDYSQQIRLGELKGSQRHQVARNPARAVHLAESDNATLTLSICMDCFTVLHTGPSLHFRASERPIHGRAQEHYASRQNHRQECLIPAYPTTADLITLAGGSWLCGLCATEN